MLGPVDVDGGSGLGPRDRVVVAVLALRPGEVVPADRLADALWGEELPASWSKVVQGCIVRIRKALGTDAIRTVGSGYRLTVPRDDIDAYRFERLSLRGSELLTLGQPERAEHALREGLTLWRGPALIELSGWDLGRIEAERLHELRLDAEEGCLDAALRSGRGRDIVAEAQARVAEAPLRERRWALLARAQYHAGSQGDALRTLQRARAVLASELGLDPGPELVDLEAAILRHDDALAPAVPQPGGDVNVCPYRGLLPFDVDDADAFVGRDTEVAEAVRRLTTHGVVALVGPSGSGKSSLVRAGVAAALRRDGRTVIVVTPGARPLDALTALPATSPSPVLVVDQLEEVITLCDDADEREQFFAALAAHAGRGWLAVAVRADRLGDVSVHAELARLIEPGIYLLSPMGEVGLRMAIERPARQAGLLLEPGLVDLLIRDVEGEPGALPLLSHALRTTWEHREGRTLTVNGYLASGGIRGAVAQSAERLYAGLSSDEQSGLRELLLRLVATGPAGAVSATRMPRRLVAADPRRQRLVDILVEARLLTSDGDVVELAHEALARAWPRLRGWLDDDVEGQRIRHHLTTSTDTWDAMGRPVSELYRGARLAQAMAWRDVAAPQLAPAEAQFLEESQRREEADLRAAQEQITRERRPVRRLRALVGGVAVLALVAAGMSMIAVDQRDRADAEKVIAEARRLAAEALVEPAFDRALLLAVESTRLWDSPETRGNLVTTIERSPQAFGVIRATEGRPVDLEAATSGNRVAVTDHLGQLDLIDTDGRAAVGRLADPRRAFRAPSFDDAGEVVAVSVAEPSCSWQPCDEMAIELFDARDLSPIGERFEGLSAPATDIDIARDGDLIAAISLERFSREDHGIAVWSRDEPDAPRFRLRLDRFGLSTLPTPDSIPNGWVRFSPDGSVLYASAGAATVAFDAATGEERRRFGGGALALSADGSTLAVHELAGSVWLIDTASGERLAELAHHRGPVTAASFSADGTTLATVSTDESAVVWDVASGTRIHELVGQSGSLTGVGFSADATALYTAGADRSVFLWDLTRSRGLGRELVPGAGPPLGEGGVFVSPTGSTALFHGRMLRLVDLATGAARTLRSGDDVTWLAYHPGGRRMVTVEWSGHLQLWDLERATPIGGDAGRDVENFGAIAFAPDGDTVVTADADGVVTERDAETLDPTGRRIDIDFEPEGVRVAVDGTVAVSSTAPAGQTGALVSFVDLEREKVLRRVEVPVSSPRTNFSSDGRYYAAGGYDGRLAVIDVGTGTVVSHREPVHNGPIAWVAFSPGSDALLTLGFDGTVRMMDPATALPYARMQPSRPNLRSSLAFDEDGDAVVIAYEDGSAVSFEIDPAVWLDHACAVAGRNLTAAEWRNLFGDRPYRETCTPA